MKVKIEEDSQKETAGIKRGEALEAAPFLSSSTKKNNLYSK